MAEPFKMVKLENGLLASFYDHTNRYFGDFHRVCIEVKIDIPLQSISLPDELVTAAAKLKAPLRYEKRLEKMGVTSADLVTVRDSLISGFLASSSSYLTNPKFPIQFLKKKLLEKPRPRFPLG